MILRKWQKSYPPHCCFTASVLILYIPIGKWYFMLPIHPQENNRKAVVNVALSQRAVNTAFLFDESVQLCIFFNICYMWRDNMIICSISAALSFCAFKICWNVLWFSPADVDHFTRDESFPVSIFPSLKGFAFPDVFLSFLLGPSLHFYL